MGWLCCKQTLALFRSLFMCIRCVRSSAHLPENDSLNVNIAKCHKNQALCCKVVLLISIFTLMSLGIFLAKIFPEFFLLLAYLSLVCPRLSYLSNMIWLVELMAAGSMTFSKFLHGCWRVTQGQD